MHKCSVAVQIGSHVRFLLQLVQRSLLVINYDDMWEAEVMRIGLALELRRHL
ncbi:hypothetical protein MHI37_23715 [Paenibacillus sp. FSL H8-0548]|uniref:hypothetical protein n=1 Tax=Paenibacillus sp. FSL H8-0548 TaxID=1920422 RepID=UPI0015C34449|nr:hypothetical protein [Paenibacillus sp. FSL H8-0548]